MNIKNKTGRKNKTNLTITWPSSAFFTIKDLFSINPNFVEITMRVRVKNEIEQGKVKEIGVRQNGKGRPENIYVLSPVTSTTIDKAKDAGINLHSEYLNTKLTDIKSISQSNTQSNQTVSTHAATASV
jgi:hypothetical protein